MQPVELCEMRLYNEAHQVCYMVQVSLVIMSIVFVLPALQYGAWPNRIYDCPSNGEV